MDEFSLIRRYFTRSQQSKAVVLGIGDDGAIVSPTEGFDAVHVIDTLVEGTHFPVACSAFDIGYRSVAVNASDIAAMGALPHTMTLALTLTEASASWLEQFSAGLFACSDDYGINLIGGDTTRGSQTVVTVAMTGRIEPGRALLRSGASPGDAIFVSGTLGDAAAGLRLLLDDDRVTHDDPLVSRFLHPTPRIALGRSLLGVASAAIDVSDGLLGDLGKLAEASGCRATLDLDTLPLSASLRAGFDNDQQVRLALCGGDDYELCFTANAAVLDDLDGVTRIGEISSGSGVECRQGGELVNISDAGYRHFE